MTFKPWSTANCCVDARQRHLSDTHNATCLCMFAGLSTLPRCHIGADLLRCRACLLVSDAASRVGMRASSAHFARDAALHDPLKIKLHCGVLPYTPHLSTRRSPRPCRWSAAVSACAPQPTGPREQCSKRGSRVRCYSSATANQTPAPVQTQNGAVPKFRRRTTVKDVKVG